MKIHGLMVSTAPPKWVVEGDFYGYGEVPTAPFGPFLVDANWFVDQEFHVEAAAGKV